MHKINVRATDAMAWMESHTAPARRLQEWVNASPLVQMARKAQERHNAILGRYAYLAAPKGNLPTRPRLNRPLRAS